MYIYIEFYYQENTREKRSFYKNIFEAYYIPLVVWCRAATEERNQRYILKRSKNESERNVFKNRSFIFCIYCIYHRIYKGYSDRDKRIMTGMILSIVLRQRFGNLNARYVASTKELKKIKINKIRAIAFTRRQLEREGYPFPKLFANRVKISPGPEGSRAIAIFRERHSRIKTDYILMSNDTEPRRPDRSR